MDPNTLLVITRTQSVATRLRAALDAERYVIRWAPSVAQGLQLAVQPALVILSLPSSGGARCVARLKRSFDVPLVVLARAGQAIPEQVDASLCDSGPIEDLAEWVEVTLINHSPDRVRVANMSLDLRTRRLQIDGAVHQLRPIGCQIMALLMLQAGRVISREELFRRVWRTDDGDSTRALDVHIAHLRRQVEPDPRHPRLILTERGMGYFLQPST